MKKKQEQVSSFSKEMLGKKNATGNTLQEYLDAGSPDHEGMAIRMYATDEPILHLLMEYNIVQLQQLLAQTEEIEFYLNRLRQCCAATPENLSELAGCEEKKARLRAEIAEKQAELKQRRHKIELKQQRRRKKNGTLAN